MTIAGNAVVVIGGSSGMGLGVAEECLRQGARVTVAGRSREKLDAATRRLPGAQAVVMDVGQEADVARLFGDLASVDHVYLSAGSRFSLELATATDEAILGAFRERLMGTVYVVRHARAKMRARGSITLTTGVVVSIPKMKRPIAAALGGGVEAMAKHLAVELAPIRVNVVAPGFIETPMTDAMLGARKTEVVASMSAKHPMGRIGSVQDIARAVLHLMTNEFVTGQISVVDGGVSLTFDMG